MFVHFHGASGNENPEWYQLQFWFVSDSTIILLRIVCLFYRMEVHTAQSQAIMGTPVLVPVAKKSYFKWRIIHVTNVECRNEIR